MYCKGMSGSGKVKGMVPNASIKNRLQSRLNCRLKDSGKAEGHTYNLFLSFFDISTHREGWVL